jgi:cell wall-associated NlpC family hydrolase
LALCGAGVVVAQPTDSHPAVTTAYGLIGVPYRYGGQSPAGFDCSGLVQYVFARSGIQVPRTSQGQFAAAEPVAREAVAVGDVLFFRQRGKLSHVALYVGDGHFIHAPSSGRQVERVPLDGYWQRHLVGAGRFR